MLISIFNGIVTKDRRIIDVYIAVSVNSPSDPTFPEQVAPERCPHPNL